MTNYACRIPCAGCRKKESCDTPRKLPDMRAEDILPRDALDSAYLYREVRAPIPGHLLACGCHIPECIIVLIGTKGQQVWCEHHKQYSRIKPEAIAKAKKASKRTVAAGQGTLSDCPY